MSTSSAVNGFSTSALGFSAITFSRSSSLSWRSETAWSDPTLSPAFRNVSFITWTSATVKGFLESPSGFPFISPSKSNSFSPMSSLTDTTSSPFFLPSSLSIVPSGAFCKTSVIMSTSSAVNGFSTSALGFSAITFSRSSSLSWRSETAWSDPTLSPAFRNVSFITWTSATVKGFVE